MKLLITRPMTAAVAERARAEFDAEIRSKTSVLSREEMLNALRDYDLVVPTLGDMFGADIFAEAGEARCKLLANFGVGYNHIDVAAAQARLFEFYRQGRIDPFVSLTLPLERFSEALDRIREGRVMGKVVLNISGH